MRPRSSHSALCRAASSPSRASTCSAVRRHAATLAMSPVHVAREYDRVDVGSVMMRANAESGEDFNIMRALDLTYQDVAEAFGGLTEWARPEATRLLQWGRFAEPGGRT